MTTDQSINFGNLTDGFDLIEYPCDYGFKAMCRVDNSAEQSASETLREVILQYVSASQVLKIRTNRSRTGRFESVTITVRLRTRQELEAIYQAISCLSLVVMTL